MFHPQQEKDMQKTWAVEKLDETGARLEMCPRKLLVCLARQVGVSASATWIAIKLLHLHPYNMNEVQNSTAHIMKKENWCLGGGQTGMK
jgi:hypothetical protein